MSIKNNIKDVALIFEGGGMRASYTAGLLNILLENNLYFDYVAGISAGSSHCVNYISRDTERARQSFVELVLDPNFGGWKSFLSGKGFFNSKYIYEDAHYNKALLPLDFDTFMKNPATLKIGAFELGTGIMKYFSKDDIHEVEDLMKIVRSSSSMPIFMPPTKYREHTYLDGGLGGGIALDIAKRDGFSKFFVLLSQEKGYRKKSPKFSGIIKSYYKKHPEVIEALMKRHLVYNETLDELEQLESDGKAFLVYPNTMNVSNREINYQKLVTSYELGYSQGKKDITNWMDFLSQFLE